MSSFKMYGLRLGYGHRNQTSIAYRPSIYQGLFTGGVFSEENREACLRSPKKIERERISKNSKKTS